MNTGEIVTALMCLLLAGLVASMAISAAASGRASSRRADKALKEQPNPQGAVHVNYDPNEDQWEAHGK